MKKNNKNLKLKDVKKALRIRNISDTKRKNSPLLKHRDSVVIDTGKLNKRDMLAKMSTFVEKELKKEMAIEQETAKTNPLLEEFSKLLDDDFKDRKLVENKIIKAKVIEILKSFVVVDARAKSEAMIPISEFSQEELSKLKVGTTINCFLERIENMKTGEIVLSYDKAKRMDAWNKVVKAYDNKEEIDGMITSKIKGGFIFQAFSGALPCFLPSSQLDTRPLKKLII